METKLIEFRKEEHNQKMGKLEFFGTLFTQAIEIFNSFDYGKFEKKDLRDLIVNTEAYIRRKALESKDLSALTALGLDESKILTMLKTPERLSELHTKLDQINRIFKRDQEGSSFVLGSSLKELLHRFEFSPENEIKIKQSYKEELRKSFEVKISSAEAINLFNFGNELIALYDKYKLTNCFNSNSKDTINRLFNFTEDKISLNINHIANRDGKSKR